MPSAAHYSLRYMGIVNQLLSTDYVCIHEYASIAVRAVPGSLDAHYWLTYAMLHLGSTEMARNELRIAKQVLTTDDYYDMLRRLNIDDPENIG